MKIVERPSPNFNERQGGGPVDILVLHYTGMPDAESAMKLLTSAEAKVSSHYTVDEHGTVYAHVPENLRAWHAGVSSWGGATDINSRSIGIEIVNPGHEYGYRPFAKVQIATVIELSKAIVKRWPIPPARVLAHSDVAPQRKLDPGEKFPWARLHRAGIGAWVTPAPIRTGPVLGPADNGPEVADLQAALARHGYGIEATGVYDEPTEAVVTAFQRHFRPDRVDGRADRSTIETLRALLAAADR